MPQNRIQTRADGRKIYKAQDPNGKRYQLTQRKYESATAFKKRCDELDLVCSQITRESTLTFRELYAAWERDYQKVHCSKADVRILTDISTAHVLPVFGARRVSTIKRPEVYRFLSGKVEAGYSESLVKKCRQVFSRPYNWAIDQLGLDLVSPTQGLRLNYSTGVIEEEDEPRIRVITNDELVRFFKAAVNTKYYNYYKLLLYTGLRPSEGLGLQIKDNTKEGLIIRRKVSRDGLGPLKTEEAYRTIPLTAAISETLQQQLSRIPSGCPWYFPASRGKPNMSALTSAFNRTVRQTQVWQKIGRKYHGKLIEPALDIVLYDFRHTFATLAAEKLDLKSLQKLMGHSDIQTTLQYYVSFTDNSRRKAAAQLEELFAPILHPFDL